MNYADWVRDGSPYTDCVPNVELARLLRGYGYTVYTKGDTSHMRATPPEDHTPFSATGWPVASPYPYGHAIDVMPPAAGSSLPSLAELGRQLFDDRTGVIPGAALIKYMNWEPNGPGGSCWHDAWQPSHTRTPSTDRGHIHLSWRSDATKKTLAGYDPVARLRGDDMTAADTWTYDGIPAPAPPYANDDWATNKKWRADNSLAEVVRQGRETAAKLAALAETVNTQGKMLLLLSSKLDELLARPTGGTGATTGQGTFEWHAS